MLREIFTAHTVQSTGIPPMRIGDSDELDSLTVLPLSYMNDLMQIISPCVNTMKTVLLSVIKIVPSSEFESRCIKAQVEKSSDRQAPLLPRAPVPDDEASLGVHAQK